MNKLPRDKFGHFVKGIGYRTGTKASLQTRLKMSRSATNNPKRFSWLGKKRKIKFNRIIRNSGYVYLSWALVEDKIRIFFNNPKGKPIPEHQYVWIKQNKIAIPKGFVIHHIDHNRSNNNIKNLMLLKSGLHSKNHFQGKPNIKTSIANKGKRLTEEHKKKVSEGLKRAYKLGIRKPNGKRSYYRRPIYSYEPTTNL